MPAPPSWRRWWRRRGEAGERRLGPGPGQRVDAAGEPALVPPGRVVVNHALLRRLVDLADGVRERAPDGGGVAPRDGGAQALDPRLEPRQVATVAVPMLEALPLLLQGRCV